MSSWAVDVAAVLTLVGAPLALAWLLWDERRYRRQRRHEDEAMRLANERRHPSRLPKHRAIGPEDEPGWTRFAWKEGDE